MSEWEKKSMGGYVRYTNGVYNIDREWFSDSEDGWRYAVYRDGLRLEVHKTLTQAKDAVATMEASA